MSTGACSSCGKTLASRYASRCGDCRRRETAIARAEGYVYKRTHVHVGEGGRLSIEEGLVCGCQERQGAA